MVTLFGIAISVRLESLNALSPSKETMLGSAKVIFVSVVQPLNALAGTIVTVAIITQPTLEGQKLPALKSQSDQTNKRLNRPIIKIGIIEL